MIIDEANNLKKTVEKITNLKNKIASNLELLQLEDEEIKELIISQVSEIKEELEELEVFALLNGPYDKYNAVLEIHPGAGGTESCDWASMLFRMYTRWCEKKGFKYEVVDEQKGEEAGIKSVSMIIYGINAYGYLKNEKVWIKAKFIKRITFSLFFMIENFYHKCKTSYFVCFCGCYTLYK